MGIALAGLARPAFGQSADAVLDGKPRFELRIPSVRHLHVEVMRSHVRALVAAGEHMLAEAGQRSAEGVRVGDLESLLATVADWPDFGVEAFTFAPDLKGRARWCLAVGFPLKDLRDRVKTILGHEAAAQLFEGVTLVDREGGEFALTVSDEPVAYIKSIDEGRSLISSHADLMAPTTSLSSSGSNDDGRSEDKPVLQARLNLAKTETDSGATFFSSFSAVTAIEYAATVASDGDWDETVQVHWPPISGMGAKALFDRVDQTFFVPDEAFGAAVMNMPMAAGMLDGMAGLGPQVVMESPGQMEFVDEARPGPIGMHIESDICFTLLPGTGFLPAPDLVIQVRTRRTEELVEALREDTKRINALMLERELPQPWHEIAMRDRAVFWSDPSGGPRGMMMPFVMRPVLFTTKETDARDREREFLVLGMTTTDPERFVERWLNQPRTKSFRHLPSEKKTNGQVWMNWRLLYGFISPYVNLTLNGAGIDALIPSASTMKDDLSDGNITAKLRYSGLTARHKGPFPVGVVLVPALAAGSLAPDQTGGSDLARERLASQRLKLLHHHSKLFKKDVGRWPAEVGELDGYVDFAGHPELLDLRLSARKQWSELFAGITRSIEDGRKDEDADELDGPAIKSDLFVIDWSPDRWHLGFKEGTFEHLERLFIDQDGDIHRVARVAPPPTDAKEPVIKEDTTKDQPQEKEESSDDADDDEGDGG